MASPTDEQPSLAERVARLEEAVANLASALGAYLIAPRKHKAPAMEVAEQVFTTFSPALTSTEEVSNGGNSAASD